MVHEGKDRAGDYRGAESHEEGEENPPPGVHRKETSRDEKNRKGILHLEEVPDVNPEQVLVEKKKHDREGRGMTARPARPVEVGQNCCKGEGVYGGAEIECRGSGERQKAGKPGPEQPEDKWGRYAGGKRGRGLGHLAEIFQVHTRLRF